MPEGHAPIERRDDAGTVMVAANIGASASAAARYRVLWGILSVSTAFAIFTLHDAGIKWLVAGFLPLQVLFIRSTVIFTICCVIGRKRLLVRAATSPIRNALLLRSIGLLGAWFCFYTAARRLELAELTTIYFASPLMVAALAVPILGETVTRGRWFSILIGFAGVLIACRPNAHAPASAIGMALAAAALWAASMILIRQIALKESTLVQMITSSFGFIVMTGPPMFWLWQTPHPTQLLLMASIGTLGTVAQFLLIEGIKRAPASVVSPLEFTALVWSFLLGYVIWGDIPGLNVFGGAALILVSGALIVGSEWRIARRAARLEAAAE